MNEKRKYKRLDIDVTLKFNELSEGIMSEDEVNEGVAIKVFNISKSGMGFTSEKDIPIGVFFSVNVVLWMRDSFDAVIKIVRKNKNEDMYEYGCEFIGLADNTLIKIDIYQMFLESKTKWKKYDFLRIVEMR